MNETALITGASSGIGLEFAHILAKQGYNLVLVARRQHLLDRLKRQLESEYPITVKTVALDLSRPESAESLFTLTSMNAIQIDLLVNNAGFGDYGDFIETDVQKNYEMLQVNIVSLTALTRLYAPAMVERQRGGMINLASIVAFQPGPLMAVYYASKAYVLSFTEALASELVGSGVKVTALCPGPTDTGFADVTGLEKSVLFQRFQPVPAKKVAEFGYRSWERGKVVAIYGLPNKSLVFGERFLPRGVTSNLMKWMQKKAV
ncbi:MULTISPECIES: SDR family NAD(P)-dependent oxidoreductase [Exiguobacterium]|uniref:SDR family NAD(P)-dependent oxidoreductase n=1 Tax=Exiguobacterium TaxID=33986 RepID=UPI001BEC63C0|nr:MULTISPECIES: SDR family oxidoreductase [Exiguobacterium]MCT4778277.1 SDR family oxidoreductase [Exiguobacterium aquaticum]MCT4790193.1 SDR family oxidoreductase [Exiguobacterium mexicanum]